MTTYNTVVNDEALFAELDFDVVVLDEASLIKNPFSQWTSAINKLNFSFMVAMTGTPFENSVSDLWSITNALKKDFLGEWRTFQTEFLQTPLDQIPNSSHEKIESQISKIMLRRLKENVLTELPPIVQVYTPITMMERERRTYLNLENDIKDNLTSREVAFKKISDLRKFTSHPFMMDGSLVAETLENIRAVSGKFQHLIALIEGANKNDKILVFANNIDIIHTFTTLFENDFDIKTFKIDGTVASRLRQNVLDTFSKVKGKSILFLNPKTAGMGLNIIAANHVIHYSRQWNPALENQATARAYRNGQEKTVFVHYLYYADSIEERIHERLHTKTNVSNLLIQPTFSGEADDLFFEQLMEETHGK